MKLTSSEWQAQIGRNGGKARAKKLTPKQRQESARKAAKARWGDRNGTAAALEPAVTAKRPVAKPKKGKP